MDTRRFGLDAGGATACRKRNRATGSEICPATRPATASSRPESCAGFASVSLIGGYNTKPYGPPQKSFTGPKAFRRSHRITKCREKNSRMYLPPGQPTEATRGGHPRYGLVRRLWSSLGVKCSNDYFRSLPMENQLPQNGTQHNGSAARAERHHNNPATLASPLDEPEAESEPEPTAAEHVFSKSLTTIARVFTASQKPSPLSRSIRAQRLNRRASSTES